MPMSEIMEEIKCLCGCESILNKYDKYNRERRFLPGHNRKGKTATLDHRTKMSLALKGHVSFRKGFGLTAGEYRRETGRRARRIFRELKVENDWRCMDCNNVFAGSKLHTHHINGDTSNNLKENLRILCAKCHIGLHTKIINEQRSAA